MKKKKKYPMTTTLVRCRDRYDPQAIFIWFKDETGSVFIVRRYVIVLIWLIAVTGWSFAHAGSLSVAPLALTGPGILKMLHLR